MCQPCLPCPALHPSAQMLTASPVHGYCLTYWSFGSGISSRFIVFCCFMVAFFHLHWIPPVSSSRTFSKYICADQPHTDLKQPELWTDACKTGTITRFFLWNLVNQSRRSANQLCLDGFVSTPEERIYHLCCCQGNNSKLRGGEATAQQQRPLTQLMYTLLKKTCEGAWCFDSFGFPVSIIPTVFLQDSIFCSNLQNKQ